MQGSILANKFIISELHTVLSHLYDVTRLVLVKLLVTLLQIRARYRWCHWKELEVSSLMILGENTENLDGCAQRCWGYKTPAVRAQRH